MRLTEVRVIVIYTNHHDVEETAVSVACPVPESTNDLAVLIERAAKRVRLHLPEELR